MSMQQPSGATPRRFEQFDWNEDRINLLRRMAEGGNSAKTIANILGCTRSSVVGKAFRMGVKLTRNQGKDRRISAVRPVDVYRKPGGKTQNDYNPFHHNSLRNKTKNLPLPEVTSKVEVPLERRRTLLTLGNDECRWPYGDVASPDTFYFCGAVIGDRAGSFPCYCEEHSREAKK